MLSQSPEDAVRSAVAANPHSPSDVLARLLADEALRVQAAAIANPRTPLEALERFQPRPTLRDLTTRVLRERTGNHAAVGDV